MKQLFSVPGIHCSSCVMLLESLEEDHDAIRDVRVDLRKQTVEVDFNEDLMSSEDVIEAVEAVSGYEAIPND